MKIFKNTIISLKSNQFITSSIFSSFSALVKILTAFVISKVIAVFLGPKGLGLIGQLSSFISILLVFAGGTVNNGIVKYVAQYNSSEKNKLKPLISTALRIVFFSGCFIGLILIIFASPISYFVLQTTRYSDIFMIFGFTIIFYGLNNFLLSILNGFKEFKKFNQINIYGSVIGLIVSVLFIYTFNIYGALISLVMSQSIIFVVTLLMIRKQEWFSKSYFNQPFNKNECVKLLKFASLAIISTALIPATQFIVRKYIISHLGYENAGYWELITRISTYSLLFFSLSISTYYLPRISEIKNLKEIRHEILNAYKLIVPIAIFSLAILYFSRHLVISLLASSDFSKSSNLFLFQLIGDFFKICSWVLGFQMVGRGFIKLSLFTELFYNVFFVVFSILGIHFFGMVGVTYGYALNYLIYLLLLVFLFRNLIFKNQ